MYARGYKKLWGLYGINLDDDWYLQAVARTIFECSDTHFWTNFGTNQRMVCHTGSVTSSSCFSLNFLKGWRTFEKILYLSKAGENYLTIIGDFWPFYQNPPIWPRQWLGGFRGRQIRIIWDDWGRTILGALGLLLAQNIALFREQLAIQARWSHHRVSHPKVKDGAPLWKF